MTEDADLCARLRDEAALWRPHDRKVIRLPLVLDEAAATIEALTKERDQAIELAMIRHCDVNRNGKTILDFHEVWLRQANDARKAAEARVRELALRYILDRERGVSMQGCDAARAAPTRGDKDD